MNKNKTINKIFEYIKINSNVSPSTLVDKFSLGRAMIHRHLNKLQEKGLIFKTGVSPKVFYSIQNKTPLLNNIDIANLINNKDKKIIQKNFFFVNVDGTILKGINGFVAWCQDGDFDIKKKTKEYVNIIKKYDKFKNGKLINGIQKIKTTFQNVYVDKIYFVDFYAIEIFGKTKLGQMLLYAKQGQNRKMMKELILEIKSKIENLIKKEKINAVGFVSPSLKREIQFMKVLEKELNFPLPIISILKTRADIIVPQKTLSKLEDRIKNAQKTFVVNENRSWDTILLIDDAIGSGATINELAYKIKKQKIAKKVYGFAITGSLKWFDVISEV
ncbi:MAG: hypothetical protein AAB526_03740 [Patescibacteria group bacterium]